MVSIESDTNLVDVIMADHRDVEDPDCDTTLASLIVTSGSQKETIMPEQPDQHAVSNPRRTKLQHSDEHLRRPPQRDDGDDPRREHENIDYAGEDEKREEESRSGKVE